jgi:AbrB family looped-hinge helix DNA binding protein
MKYHILCMDTKFKDKLRSKLLKQHKKLQRLDKLYGTTTLGARGQVVIPAEARKDLGLKPGDQLVALGKFGKILALMKTEQLSEFIETVMKHVSGTGVEGEIREHLEHLFGTIGRK